MELSAWGRYWARDAGVGEKAAAWLNGKQHFWMSCKSVPAEPKMKKKTTITKTKNKD